MASGLRQIDKGHIEARYEYPWGGVASDAAPMDIQPNQFQQCDGFVIKDGVLNAACLDNVYVHPDIDIFLIFNIGDAVYFVSGTGDIYGSLAGIPSNLFPDTAAPLASNAGCTDPDCVQVINGLAYIFSQGVVGVYVFDPVALTFTLGSNFVAGLYCCTVDQYLITANTNQPTDTPAIKHGRVNWSGPDEYTTWDPAIDRTAGFNVLTDVSDYISGCFAMGNVAYILRSQGLTQMTPTGIGIQPFDFTSLWASDHGIGCTFPKTFAQYGFLAIWMNDVDIYLFSGGSAPQGMCGAAKSNIYADLISNDPNDPEVNRTVFVSGCISNGTITITGNGNFNSKVVTPELEYNLFIVILNHSNTSPYTTSWTIINWIYSFKSKTWTRLVKNIPITGVNASTYISGKIGTSVYGQFQFEAINDFTPILVSRLVPLLFINDSESGTPFLLSRYQADLKYEANALTASPAIVLTFKQEEIRLTRQPEIRGVAIKAQGVGTLTVTVSGQININNVMTPVSKTFTAVVVNTTTLATFQSSGIFTGEDPTLTITSSSFDGVVAKAAMFGTYADGEPF